MPLRHRTHPLFGFAADARGSVSVMVGITCVVIVALLGAGIDYGRSQADQAMLDAALDAAVLAAAQAVRQADDQGLSDAKAKQAGQDAGAAAFRSFAGDTIAATAAVPAFDVVIEGRSVSVDGGYTAATQTAVMQLIQIPKVRLSGRSAAKVDLSTQIDIYLLIDVSGSMAIGATQADIDALQAGIGCAFACHDGSPVNGTALDGYQWAKASGIKLRLQEMNDGILDFVAWLRKQPTVAKRVRIAIYSFSTTLTKVLDVTSDLSRVASNLPQAPSTSGEYDGATLWGETLAQFTPKVGASGDGITKPRKLVMIATDGVQDPGRYWTSAEWVRPSVTAVSPEPCKGLKAVNATTKQAVAVGIIHTPYIAMPWDWGYLATLGQPSQIGGGGTRLDDVPGQLKACATSPDLYIDATKTSSIGQAMQKVFASFAQVRLTK
ncbi:pilus assembly protein [Methylobacterium oryzisoli]|uniref:pilus assembly protein n=1 Tax=Methylobacterium oryzisoli TaxID=3385502 RepID=UPI00397AE12C